VTQLSEVVITAPDPDWLLDVARQFVGEGLAASVHCFAPVRSVYRWRGEVVERTEGRISLHTRTELVPMIVERVKAVHPYEVPGISARPIVGGNPEYLQWMRDETGTPDAQLARLTRFCQVDEQHRLDPKSVKALILLAMSRGVAFPEPPQPRCLSSTDR
jgi:periplasmic divalent cation tolerance protein